MKTKKLVVKTFLSLLIGLSVAVGISGVGQEVYANNSELRNPRITEDGKVTWDTVEFGSYYQDVKEFKTEPIKWRILSINEDGTDAVVMADRTLDYKQYNEDYADDVKWENCSLRKWLNEDFYETAFSEKEQAVIHSVNITNQSTSISDGYQIHVSEGGNDTIDKVYLLSLDEALNSSYGFEGSIFTKSHYVNPTDYTRYKGDSYEYSYSEGGLWGLRATKKTFESDRNHFIVLYADGLGSYCINYCMPVRPVIHVDLNADCVQDAGEVDSSGNVTSLMNGYKNPEMKNGITTWDCIYFGEYKQTAVINRKPITWRVLSVNEDGTDVFLMSDQVLDCKFYNDNSNDVTWETCSLRKWLNEEFYEDAFTTVQRSAIISSDVVNKDNGSYHTNGGKDTTDKVYLLSIDEMNNSKYGFYKNFDVESSARELKPTDYARIQGRDIDRKMKWWLRSPGKSSKEAAIIYSNGEGSDYGYYVNGDLETAVCPVLHVNLSALNIMKKGEVTVNEEQENQESENEELRTISFNVTYHQSEAREMLESINEFRQDSDNAWYWDEDDSGKIYCSNLEPLDYDYELEKIAMLRAAEIAVNYSHKRPDGTKVSALMENYYAAGENIAYGQTTGEEVYLAWREDNDSYVEQGHRRNMLGADYNRIGIACAEYQRVKFWVQVFGGTDQKPVGEILANDEVSEVSISILNDNIKSRGFYANVNTYKVEKGKSKKITLPQPYIKLTDSAFTICPVETKSSFQIMDTSVASINGNMLCGLANGESILTAKAEIAGESVEQNYAINVYGYTNPLTGVVTGEVANSKKDFTIGSKVKFNVPSNVPIIGDGKVELDFGVIPVSFEREGNDYRLGIGVSDVKKFDEEGWPTFKKFVETQKKEYKTGVNHLLAKNFGTATMGMEVKPKINCFGYAEGTITNNGVESAAGKMFIEIKSKGSQEWQTTVIVVPVVIKFSIEVGVKTICSVGLDFNNSSVYFEGKLEMTIPKIKLSGGVGVSHIWDISVYGSAENKIVINSSTKKSNTTPAISATLSGEMGASAKFLFTSYEKPLVSGKWVYYNSSKKSSDNIQSSSMNTLYSAGSNAMSNNIEDWELDDTVPSVWQSERIVLNSGNPGSVEEDVLKSGIYDDASPQILKTSDGTMLITYIDVVKMRSGVNRYAAVYSIYDYESAKWKEPVIIDDDATADFNVRAVTNGNEVFFVWCNMKDIIDDEMLQDKNKYSEAMSLAEIEMAELDVSSKTVSTVSVTDNNVLDFKPDICIYNNNMYVTWCQNSENDFTLESGDNTIHFGMVDDSYEELTYKTTNGAINDLTIGTLDDSVYVAYVEYVQELYSINTISDAGLINEICDNSTVISNPTFCKVRGSNVLLWCSREDEKNSLYYTDNSDISLLLKDTDINGDYYILNENGWDLLICSSSMDDDHSKLCGYKIYKSSVSDVMYLFDKKGKVSSPTATKYNDGYIILYKNSSAEITETTMDVNTDLCVANVFVKDNVEIEDVEYLDEEMLPAGQTTVTVSVKNNGLDASDNSLKIEILCGDEIVGRKTLSDIESGDNSEQKISITLPDNLSENSTLTVRTVSDDKVVSNEKFLVGHPDLEIQADYEDSMAHVSVGNVSDFGASASLYVYDTDEDGELLTQYSLGEIAAGSKAEKDCDVSGYSDVESLMFVVRSEDEELFDFNNRVSVYIGNDVLKTLDHIEAFKEKTEYNVGDSILLDDLTVYAKYTDGSYKQITDYVTNVENVNTVAEGTDNLTITYEEVGLTAEVDIPITTKNYKNILETPGENQSSNISNNPNNRQSSEDINISDGQAFTDGSTIVLQSITQPIGTIVKNATDKSKYKVISNTTVSYSTSTNVNAKQIVIPNTVILNGVKYNVIEIEPNAFKKCKKITKVTIGSNVTKIGKNAFKNCKNLKNIIIKTTKLNKNSIGKNAFKGISKKATFKCPKKQLKNYKKWIKKAGAPKTTKYKKQ